MPLRIVRDDIPMLETILALMKATRSANHEVLKRFCEKRGGTVLEFMNLKIGGVRVAERMLQLVATPVPPTGDDQISRLKRTNLVAVDREVE